MSSCTTWLQTHTTAIPKVTCGTALQQIYKNSTTGHGLKMKGDNRICNSPEKTRKVQLDTKLQQKSKTMSTVKRQ